MKGPDYMSQLNGREQNAFYCIKKLVAARLQPLIIYCYGCETLVHTRRNCFMTKQRTEQRQFSCDLLLITPDECVIDDALKTEVQEITSHLGKVNMIIHPLSFVIQQLNAQNLFLTGYAGMECCCLIKTRPPNYCRPPLAGNIAGRRRNFIRATRK